MKRSLIIFLVCTMLSSIMLAKSTQGQVGNNTLVNSTLSDMVGYVKLNGTGFSLQYPAEWKVENEPLPFPPGAYEYRISGDNIQQTGFLDVSVVPGCDSCRDELGIPKNATQAQIESQLDIFFPKAVNFTLSGFREQPSQIEEPNYDKYIIDGHRAGSVLFTKYYGNTEVKDLLISTIVNNTPITVVYSAPVTVFDKNIPIVENIIKSIKLTV